MKAPAAIRWPPPAPPTSAECGGKCLLEVDSPGDRALVGPHRHLGDQGILGLLHMIMMGFPILSFESAIPRPDANNCIGVAASHMNILEGGKFPHSGIQDVGQEIADNRRGD